MKKAGKRIIMLVLVIIVAAVLFMKKSEAVPISIFSWHWEEMQEKEWQPLLWAMEELKIRKIYQDFDMDQSPEARKKFWELFQGKNCEVYYLCGDPKWAYPSRMDRITEAIEEAAKLKEESQDILKGIVFDVEPYTLEEWDEEAGDLMDAYVTSMKYAYDTASAQGLEVVLCIPNFYDKKYGKNLEMLIGHCCDGIAVMNYSNKDQEEKIKNEADLARKYGKTLIHISEVEKGKETEVKQQMQEIEILWKNIKREYCDTKLEFSYHHLGALMELYDGGEHDE